MHSQTWYVDVPERSLGTKAAEIWEAENEQMKQEGQERLDTFGAAYESI